MERERGLWTADTMVLVWAAALYMWTQQFFPAGPVGEMTALAVLWTAAYAPAVHLGVPVRRYWLALLVAVGSVGVLSAIKPVVPEAFRVWSTGALLAVALVMVLRRSLGQRAGRSGS